MVYRYCGADRSWLNANQIVTKKGAEDAAKWAESEYNAVSKAKRDDNFQIERESDNE